MKKTKEEENIMKLPVLSLIPGQVAQANDGGFYKVLNVDPILDPREEVFEKDTKEALVRFDKGEKCEYEIVKGMVRVQAA